MADDEPLLKAQLALAFLLLILLSLLVQSGEAGGCYPEDIYPECDDGWPINGYWWHDFGVWVPGYISLDTWFMPAPDHFKGRVVYYAAGMMEATAAWRGMSLKGYVDGVALMSPADIGEEVWIKFNGGWEGPFLVVDCARRGDMWPVIVHRDEAVEVGWRTALKWGLEPPFPIVEVSKIAPKDAWSISYSYWFQRNAKFDTIIGPRVYFRPPNQWRINGEWKTFNNYHELSEEPKRAIFLYRRIR